MDFKTRLDPTCQSKNPILTGGGTPALRSNLGQQFKDYARSWGALNQPYGRLEVCIMDTHQNGLPPPPWLLVVCKSNKAYKSNIPHTLVYR